MVKVLLIADPPMGDKFAARLSKLDAGDDLDVEYIRGGAEQPHRIPDRLPPGVSWVLAMNAGRKGSTLREAARRAGATFVSIPPSWAQAEPVLEQHGFFKAIRRSAASHGGPGADRALKTLGPVDPTPGMRVVSRELIQRLDAGDERVRDAASKAMHEHPLHTHPPLTEKCGCENPPPRPEPKPVAADGPAKVVGFRQRAPEPEPEASPTVDDPRQTTLEEQIAARTGGPPIAREPEPEWRRVALAMMERNPEIQGTVVVDALRAQGVEVNEQTFYAFRREWRSARGLDPSGGQVRYPRRRASAPAREAIEVTREDVDSLPDSVLDLQRRLVAALRETAGLHQYHLTFVGGEAEVTYEREVKTTAKGKTTL